MHSLSQRDHRVLAEEMEIFFLDPEIGAGLPVWLPHGVAIRDALEDFMKRLEHRGGYQRVASPHIGKARLYERSGHLEHFREDMFPPMDSSERESFYLKPMNCPHHHKVFSSRPRSYRDLPLRLAEYGQVYRFERAGALRGLSRVRGLCQNDSHIYVAPERALDEVIRVLKLHEKCYRLLGLSDYRYRLSLSSDRKPEGEWARCEEILKEALIAMGLEYFEAPGEAAFYGPKIDVQMCLIDGREESVASLQLDPMSAAKFELNYVESNGARARPWIIHRAPLGSHERFVALLLERYEGRLPGWLSPIQVALVPALDDGSASVSERIAQIESQLRARGVRVHVDRSQGHLSKRIKHLHRLRPFSIQVIGDKEIESGFDAEVLHRGIEKRIEVPIEEE